MLSKDNLRKVKQVDKSMKDDTDYASFCIATGASDLSCDPNKAHISVVNFIEAIPS